MKRQAELHLSYTTAIVKDPETGVTWEVGLGERPGELEVKLRGADPAHGANLSIFAYDRGSLSHFDYEILIP